MTLPEYSALEFHNSSGNIGIVLQGWTMIDSKQAAQDRTVPYAQLIKAGKNRLTPANCIQANQNGHFNCSKIDQDNFQQIWITSFSSPNFDKCTTAELLQDDGEIIQYPITIISS